VAHDAARQAVGVVGDPLREDVARILNDGTFAKDRLNAMDPEQRFKTPWIPDFLKLLERNRSARSVNGGCLIGIL
jgi:hypothetical protein